jgi:hypothetical protein
MEGSVKRVLVVANRTAASSLLVKEIRRQVQAGACEFTLLVPDVDDGRVPTWARDAVQVLSRAAGAPVATRADGPDPVASVEAAITNERFDEIIVSTLSKRTSKWLRRDLASRVQGLGPPVTVITPPAHKTERDYMPGAGEWPG